MKLALSFFISLAELAFIKLLSLLVLQAWSPWLWLLLIPLFLVNLLLIKIPRAKGLLKPWLIGFLVLIGLTILLTPLHSYDLFGYYIPNADYLNTHLAFKNNIIPSAFDGTYAYPPIEYCLISLLTGLNLPYPELWLKALLFLKVIVFLSMLFLLIKERKDAGIIAGFLMMPFVLSNSVYSYYQDLNILIATEAALLLLSGRLTNIYVVICLLCYGILSKYIFIPYLFIALLCLLPFIKKAKAAKQLCISILIAGLFSLPWFIRNAIVLHNPVYPLLLKVFPSSLNSGPGILKLLKDQLIAYHFDWEFLRTRLPYFLVSNAAAFLLIHGKDFRFRFWSSLNRTKQLDLERSILFCFVLLGSLLWLLLMNPVLTAAPIRFFYPVMLSALVLSQNSKKLPVWIIILSVIALIITQKNGSIEYIVFGLPVIYYAGLLLKISYRRLLLGAAMLILPFRIYSNGFAVAGGGYEYYIPGHGELLRRLGEHPHCLTSTDLAIPPEMEKEKHILRLYTYEGIHAAMNPDSAGIRYIFSCYKLKIHITADALKDFPALAARFTPVHEEDGLIFYHRRDSTFQSE